MHPEHPHTLEDKVAERLARIGTQAAIISVVVLLAVIFGNVLVLAVKIAVNVVLAALVNQGPAVAALLGGISTAIGYYGRTRLLRRKDTFKLRDEARDQTLDQAGNALQNAPAALRSRLGCSSYVSLGVFVVSLIVCFLTYLPPLRVFGANLAAATATPTLAASTSTSVARVAATATNIPPATTATSSPVATATPIHAPTATRTAVPILVPTATATPAPGTLVILPPTTVALGNAGVYCAQTFTGATFSFKNAGGTPIYWTIIMPTPFYLAQGYAATGSLPPNGGNTQNEIFQGTATATPIAINWGYSPTNEPMSASIPVTCKPIG